MYELWIGTHFVGYSNNWDKLFSLSLTYLDLGYSDVIIKTIKEAA